MGGPSVPTPSYTPQYSTGADSTYNQNLGLLSGNASTGQGLANNVVNNPYSSSVIPGAQYAGNYLTGSLSPQLTGASSQLQGAASGGLPYAQQTLQTAYDPQNALYKQDQQQNTDQTFAALNATGTANTPYSAGVANQSNQNFNTNWQNQQLARQTQGLQDYTGYLSSLGSAGTTAGQLGTAGAGAYTTGSALPYSTYTGMQNTGLGALSSASGLDTSATGAAGNYLQTANQNYSDQLQAYQAQLQQQQGLFGGLGSILGFGADALGLGGGGLGNILGLGGSGVNPVSLDSTQLPFASALPFASLAA